MADTKPSKTDSKPKVVSEQVGLWRIKWRSDDNHDTWSRLKDTASALPLFYRMATEVYTLNPTLFVIFVALKIWSGVESAILTNYSSKLLQAIELALKKDDLSWKDVFIALLHRAALVALSATIQWYSVKVNSLVEARATGHFDMTIMQVNLKINMSTKKVDRYTSADQTWGAFIDVFAFMSELCQVISQLALAIHLLRSAGSPLFILLCIARPFIGAIYTRSVRDKECGGWINNPHYIRMMALSRLASRTRYKQDVRSGNLVDYILKEYRAAYEKLGTIPVDRATDLYERHPFPWFGVIKALSGDLAMAYFAVYAILHPTALSLSSIAILETSSSQLRNSFEMLHTRYKLLTYNMKTMRAFFLTAPSEMEEKNQTEIIPYPQEESSEKGMSFELRNVTFQYEGSTKTTNALNNISLSIEPGQLVVLVGSNGSGKSTLVKLLSQLYNPNDGSILVDGHAATAYNVGDLRNSSVIFSQDSNILPLPLGENIGIGNPDHVDNKEMIMESARKGGSLGLISKYDDGLSSNMGYWAESFLLNCAWDCYPDYIFDREDPEYRQCCSPLFLSGGEEQRIVASRAFMRLMTDRIKFVAVDEPTSALDAEGELQLFQNLIDAREGKTMIFVTHRFGHLTRLADKIICMKDGIIAESGTHTELMELKGEYAKLYNIQASAYAKDGDETSPK